MKKSGNPDWYFYLVLVYAAFVSGGLGWMAYGDGGMPLRYPIGLAVIFYFAVVFVSLFTGSAVFKALENRRGGRD